MLVADTTGPQISLEESCSDEEWSELGEFLDGIADALSSSDKPPAQEEHKAQVECRTQLTHEEFTSTYRHKRPVLLRGFAKDWTSQANWTNHQMLGELLGDGTQVLVLRSPDGKRFLKRDCLHESQPFASVVHDLFAPQCDPSASNDRLYGRAPLAAGLRAKAHLGALSKLVGGSKPHAFRDINCGVWLGSAGCVTPLHYDLCHGFLVGVLGTKRITYYAPDDFRALYSRELQPEVNHAPTPSSPKQPFFFSPTRRI